MWSQRFAPAPLKFSQSSAHQRLEIAHIEARENAGLNGIPELCVFEGKQIMLVDLSTETNLTKAAHVTSDCHDRYELEVLGCLFRFFHPTDDIFAAGWNAFLFDKLDSHLAGGNPHVEYLRFPNRYIMLLSMEINGDVARRLDAQEKQLADIVKQTS